MGACCLLGRQGGFWGRLGLGSGHLAGLFLRLQLLIVGYFGFGVGLRHVGARPGRLRGRIRCLLVTLLLFSLSL